MPSDPSPPRDEIPEGDGLFGLADAGDEAGVAVIPVPYDATTSYRPGTRHGPAAVIRASTQIDLHDARFGDIWRVGVTSAPIDDGLRELSERMRPAAERLMRSGDSGAASDRRSLDEAGDRVNEYVEARVREAFDRGQIPCVLGGEHSVPYASIRACAEREPISLLHIDAHWDLRAAYLGMRWSHASIIHNVMHDCDRIERLVSVGVRDASAEEWAASRALGDRLAAFPAHALADASFTGKPWDETCHEIAGALPNPVYITFDIDGLEPSLCPSTGTPVPGGLGFEQASRLLQIVAEARPVVGCDLVEVTPGAGFPGTPDSLDAIVGSRMLYRLIGAAAASRAR